MTAFTVLMAVMFGVYLMNFISPFLTNFMAGWNKWARRFAYLLIGFVLLMLLVASATNPNY